MKCVKRGSEAAAQAVRTPDKMAVPIVPVVSESRIKCLREGEERTTADDGECHPGAWRSHDLLESRGAWDGGWRSGLGSGRIGAERMSRSLSTKEFY